MTVTTGGRATRSSSSPSSAPKVRSKRSSSSRSSSSGLTTWTVVVQLGAEQLQRLLVDRLGRGHHLAEVEHHLDQRGRVGVDLVGEVGQRGAARQPHDLAVAARDLHAADRRRGHVVELLTPLLLALAAARGPAAAAGRRRPPCRRRGHGRRDHPDGHRTAAVRAAAATAGHHRDRRRGRRRGSRRRRTAAGTRRAPAAGPPRPGPPGPGRRAAGTAAGAPGPAGTPRRPPGAGPPGRGGIMPGFGRGGTGAGAGADCRDAAACRARRADAGRPGAGGAGRRRRRRGCCATRGARARGPGAAGAPARRRAPPCAARAGGAAGRGRRRLGRRRSRRGGRRGRGAGLDRRCGSGFLAGAFFGGVGRGGGASVGKASRSLRATGASTVEEAVLTYSPSSLSLRESFFAGDCRALWRARIRGPCLARVSFEEARAALPHGPVRRWTCSSLVLHRVLMRLHLLRGSAGWPVGAGLTRATYSTYRRRRRPVPVEPQCPAERPTPLGESHASGSGCSHAPRPGSARRAGPGTSGPVRAATTRSSSVAAARCRQPTQVRIGPAGPIRLSDRTPSTSGRPEKSTPRLAVRSRRARGSADGGPGRSRPARASAGGLGVAVDVDAPAGQPGGQPGVLAFPADREGQLEVRHDDPGRLGGRVDDLTLDARAPATARCRRSVAGSSAQSMMSIFSPCSSATTLRTRCPIGPMQAPLAFSPATVRPHRDLGAVAGLAGDARRSRRCRRRSRAPRARTASCTRFGWVRLTRDLRAAHARGSPRRRSTRAACRARTPRPGTCSDCGSTASTLPRSTSTSPRWRTPGRRPG